MDVICDTSFLMVLCYDPIKNTDFLKIKFGKITYLIYPSVIRELTRITHTGKIKRSNIAKLSLEIIKKEVENNNFQIMSDINNLHSTREVDLQLLDNIIYKKNTL